jgi:hypothetical protein
LDHQHTLLAELRTSLEASAVAWAVAQADASLQGRPAPETLADINPHLRRKYEDVALVALMSINRDAVLYAERIAADTAYEELAQFCRDHELDWLSDDHPVNDGDALEMLIHRCATKAIIRFRHVLCGLHPGLSRHLASLEIQRATDGDPALAADAEGV